MADPLVFNGTVEWSGENPGISLKETPDGPFVTLASFFRVVLSPHGRGHALVLLQSPGDASPPPDRPNICFHDNEKLARFLVSDFVANFGAYKGLPGFANLSYRKLDSVTASGDPTSTYSEAVKAGDLTRVRQIVRGNPQAIRTRDPQFGGTPLHWAALRGYREIVAFLVAEGADVKVTNNAGETPLQVAQRMGKKDIVEFLSAR